MTVTKISDKVTIKFDDDKDLIKIGVTESISGEIEMIYLYKDELEKILEAIK